MSPPPLTPLSTSTIHKQMHTALKLTRHLPVSRLSPLSRFMSNKASAAWEAAVRESMRTPKPEMDWASVGIQPKELESTLPAMALPTAPEKKGGLLSFFSRTGSVSGPPSTNAEPPTLASRSGSPNRSSVDAASPSSPISSPLSVQPARSSLDQKSTTRPPTSSTPPLIRPASPAIASPTSSNAPALPAAQSAVSRFLGRWSKSGQGARTVSLSESDFAYLEDVPTVAEDDDGDDQMKALEKMIQSKPSLPPAKLPPPLAPPPRPPATRRSSAVLTSSAARSTTNGDNDNDEWGIFRTATPPLSVPKPPPGSSRSSSLSTASTIVPPLLPPPSKASAPTSRPTTPLLPPPNSARPRPTVATSALLARRTSNAVLSPGTSNGLIYHSPTLSPGATPITPSKPSLSPIIIIPSPSGSALNSVIDEDDGFGDFMSGPNGNLLSPMPQQGGLSNVGLRSPRITAPDTPLPGSSAQRALPPPRQSLSPLLNKIAKTQSDRWPRPSSPGALPPALAPPPSNGPPSVDLWGESLSASQPSLLVSPPLLSAPFNAPAATPSTVKGPAVGLGVSGFPSLFPAPTSSLLPVKSPSPSIISSGGMGMDGLLSLRPTSGTPSQPKPGGAGAKLTASDLSFFEGL